MNFLFACGGTAGHINPALAIAKEMCRRMPDTKILFVGADNTMENELVPKAGYELVNIRMSGLKRGFYPSDLIKNLKTVKNLAFAGRKTAEIIKGFVPDAVIGTGGYICYPVLRKAAHMGIPTIIHESNAIPGLTTRLLSTIVDKVLVSFPGLENNYRRPERVVFTGTPVRGGFKVESACNGSSDSGRKPLILSFWGSLGASRMNETIIEFMKLNISRKEFSHIHAAGRLCNATEMISRIMPQGASVNLPPDIEIRDYIDDIHAVMVAADIVISRAGGSTIAELTAMGKPAVLIPSPYVSNNEQVKNAEQLCLAGGAVVLEEKNCSGEVLFETISGILRDNNRLKSMSAAQKAIGKPRATEEIAELVLSQIISNK